MFWFASWQKLPCDSGGGTLVSLYFRAASRCSSMIPRAATGKLITRKLFFSFYPYKIYIKYEVRNRFNSFKFPGGTCKFFWNACSWKSMCMDVFSVDMSLYLSLLINHCAIVRMSICTAPGFTFISTKHAIFLCAWSCEVYLLDQSCHSVANNSCAVTFFFFAPKKKSLATLRNVQFFSPLLFPGFLSANVCVLVGEKRRWKYPCSFLISWKKIVPMLSTSIDIK